MDKKEKEVAEEYVSSLVDLNVNSKPLINMLTILAEENIEYGQIIVDAVEQHIAKIEPDYKLPVLYLIDSIVKNVGREYTALFSHSIVNIFCGVFEKVNEKIRSKMFALRQTWNDVFPAPKLYTLDVKVNCMDPGWPITAKVTPSIHVNPNFFKTKPENEMQAQLRDKQRELLELQKRKLELELAATKKHIEEQEKQLSMQTASVKSATKASVDLAPKLDVNSTVTARGQTSASVAPPVQSTNNLASTTTSLATTTSMSRTRIAPVNPALISSVRSRDPRIARQLQNQLAAANQAQQRLADDRYPSPSIGTTIYNQNPIMQSTDNVANNVKLNKMSLNNKDKDNLVNSKDTHNSKDDRIRLSSKSTMKGNSKTNTSSDKMPISSSKSSRSVDRSSSKSSSNFSDKSLSKDRNKHRKDSSKLSPYRSSSGLSGDRKKSNRNESNNISHSSSPSNKLTMKGDSKVFKPSSPSKLFKYNKSTSKNRNYMRKNRDCSKSPPPPPTGKDLDMRTIMSKITKPSISPIPPDPPSMSTSEQCSTSTVSVVQSTMKTEPKFESDLNSELIEALSVESAMPTAKLTTTTSQIKRTPSMDIDLKCNEQKIKTETCVSEPTIETVASLLTQSMNASTLSASVASLSLPGSTTTTIHNDVAATPKTLDTIKRLSQEQSSDEPNAKKIKSENLDELFGKEDVDLRTQLNPALKGIHAPTPPPPPKISSASTPETNSIGWAKIKAEIPKQPNSTLDAVRAKLAEATRAKEFVQNSHRTKDIDLRVRPPNNLDDSSQEGNEAKFKMIMSQAQEQLYNENINLEDYNTLMNQVMQIRTMQKRESMKRKNQCLSELLTPISDEEVDFSTSGSETENSKKLSRNHLKRERATDSNASKSSDNTADETAKTTSKGKRQRKTKWSPQSPWETAPNSNLSQLIFQANQSNQSSILSAAFGNSISTPQIVSNPWPAQMSFASGTGINSQLPNNGVVGNSLQLLAQQQQQHSQLVNQQIPGSFPTNIPISDRTISIDGIPREIRFYEEVAIAFMSDDGREPKEIGFQMGERRVVFDNKDSIVLSFNDVYKPCLIDGKTCRIRFGSPMRELYINNQWYECFFGGTPSKIALDGQIHVVAVDGPPPQVHIGNLRTDLVVGKVDLYVDATIKIPLYLDAEVQSFELANQVHTIQFADYLLTVLIDNQPFILEYGGMPKKFRIGNHDRFIRFSVLPNDIVPGLVYIKNMRRTDYHRGIASPQPIAIADIVPPPAVISTPSVPEVSNALTVPTVDPVISNASSVLSSDTGINANPVSAASISLTTSTVNTISTAAPAENIAPAPAAITPTVPSININDLFQKLLASGILNNNTKPVDVKPKEKFKPITLKQPENWKQRQPALIHVLFSGMQCSSCGVRFPPEHSMKYSQHLDWHFRQNRRDRDSARRAHSRRWYYDVADWIQYEEIEDLDDREKNWFESQQSAMSPANEESTQRNESPLPSCVAGPDDVDKTCDMCHDQFDTFFNEETEEWHLRNALRAEEKTYHPICYEDYKASQRVDDTAGSLEDTLASDNAVDVPADKSEEENIILDDDDDIDDVIVVPQDEPVVTEIQDDEDESPKNNRTTLPEDSDLKSSDNETVEQSTVEEKTTDEVVVQETSELASDTAPNDCSTGPEIEEKDQEENKENNGTEMEKKKENENYEPIGNESDIQILVPQISVLDLDDFEEKAIDENAEAEAIQTPIKIKEEPKDDGYDDDDDDGFEEVGTFESSIISESIIADDYDSQPAITTHQTSLITSLDGNVQIQDAPTLGPNKIRINITKNVTKNVNISSENTSKNSESSSSKIDDSQEQQQSLSQSVDNIEFEFKPSMRDVAFKKVPTVKNGLDTSGLCSIM